MEKSVLSTYLDDPQYPTITPKTVCTDNQKLGSWQISRALDNIYELDPQKREEVEKTIYQDQRDCMDEKDKLLGEVDVRPIIDEILNAESVDLEKIECDRVVEDPPSYNPHAQICKHNLNIQSPWFYKYCVDLDIDTLYKECDKENPHFKIKCLDIDDNLNKAFLRTYKFNNAQQGLQFCYPTKNDQVLNRAGENTNACPFNQTLLEDKIHSCYLNKICDDMYGKYPMGSYSKKECRERGLVKKNGVNYYLHRGEKDKDYWKNEKRS